MSKYILILLCASFVAGVLSVSPSSALVGSNIWTGEVVHVSTTNIKVYNTEGDQTLSFLLVPKFDKVFSDDGTTTLEMADIKPGMWVTVYYDQKALGVRHADKIIVLRSGEQIKS